MENAEKKKFTLKDIIYLSIIFALAVSLFLAICIPLYKPEVTYYSRKCQAFKTQNPGLSKGQIVFIGDSITDLYPLDDYYSSLPLATYNRGISGDTVHGVLNRLDVSLFDIAPSKIVIMIGINDINGSKINEYILNQYEKILTKIKENLPDSKVYIMSVLPLNEKLNSYFGVNIQSKNAQVVDLNGGIKTLAVSFGYEYIDLYSNVLDEENCLESSLTDDGIHLNANGFEVWTNTLLPYLV